MIRTFVFASILIIAFHSNTSGQNSCILKGELENAGTTEFLFLSDYYKREVVDSFLVKNGSFYFKFDLGQPKRFLLHNKRNRYEVRDKKHLWLEPAEIWLSGNADFLGNIEVVGSKSNETYYTYKVYMDSVENQIIKLGEEFAVNGDPDANTKRKAIADSLRIANHPNPYEYLLTHKERFYTEKQKQVKDRIDSLNKSITPRTVVFLKDHLDSYVALSVLHSECYLNDRHLSKPEINSIYQAMPDELKNTDKGRDIQKYVNLPDVPQIGDFAIDFAQQNPIGDTVKLSDFLGTYLLVDFWASNCGPCRAKNRDLRILYSKYQNLGLEILGVSGDTDKTNWIAAITKDSLNWTNVSDLKGWKNEAFLINDIKMIPNLLLLDREGKIIGKSIYWGQVERQIQNIFK